MSLGNAPSPTSPHATRTSQRAPQARNLSGFGNRGENCMRVSSGKSLRSPHFDCGTVSTIGRARMNLSRRNFLHLAAGAAALPAVSRIARAQDRRSRPVRIIVGFTAGSANDITARPVSPKIHEAWETAVDVENNPGGGGGRVGEGRAKTAPDGSTLYWGANGAMTINPSLQPSPAFDPARDLAPIARVLVMSSILAVNNEVPAKSVAELFVLAKAQPGKLSFASPGVGT